jgi:hypothetical protein
MFFLYKKFENNLHDFYVPFYYSKHEVKTINILNLNIPKKHLHNIQTNFKYFIDIINIIFIY